MAETVETLGSIGGLTLGLEIIREIYSRRGNGFASDPIQIETRAWASTRVAPPRRWTPHDVRDGMPSGRSSRPAFLQGKILGATSSKGPFAQARAVFEGVAPAPPPC